jgi:hypothetical protein
LKSGDVSGEMMASDKDQGPDSPDGSIFEFRQKVQGELTRIRGRLDRLEEEVAEIAPMTQEHERTLYGHPDRARKKYEPGIVSALNDVVQVVSDVKAVARAIWAVVAVGGLALIASLISVWVALAGGAGG